MDNESTKKDLPILLLPRAKRHIRLLKKEDRKLLVKLWDLILDLLEDPENGIGHPEKLKGNMEGHWSRRISQKHRLVYRILENEKEEIEMVEISACYGHYDDK